MKKFLTYFSIASLCCIASASAQNAAPQPGTQPIANPQKMERRDGKTHEEMREKRMEKFKEASPEEKAKMEKHHEMMEKLSPEQRKDVRQERERHMQEMKKITGNEMPPMPGDRMPEKKMDRKDDKMNADRMGDRGRDRMPTAPTAPSNTRAH